MESRALLFRYAGVTQNALFSGSPTTCIRYCNPWGEYFCPIAFLILWQPSESDDRSHTHNNICWIHMITISVPNRRLSVSLRSWFWVTCLILRLNEIGLTTLVFLGYLVRWDHVKEIQWGRFSNKSFLHSVDVNNAVKNFVSQWILQKNCMCTGNVVYNKWSRILILQLMHIFIMKENIIMFL